MAPREDYLDRTRPQANPPSPRRPSPGRPRVGRSWSVSLSGRCPAILLLLGWVALLMAAQVRADESYTVDWWDTGAGTTSTGGIYSLSGSIGQPDAGSLTGGEFTLMGGFWAVALPAETMAAPLLTISLTATNTVLLSWPSPSSGFVLEQAPSLDPPDWSPTGLTPTDDGATRSVIVP